MKNVDYLNKLEGEGVLLVDKPAGVSSHAVVNWARRVFGIRRIGHTGTLDPFATGLLILLIGRKYTKLQAQFLKQDKEYVCTAQLGMTTDTFDITGNVINAADWSELQKISKQEIENSLKKFRGAIKQTVPIYSAVKIKGRKLCDFARNDEQDQIKELPKRSVNIQELKLINFKLDQKQKKAQFTIRVFCSSGTYIRSLIDDIGKELKVGATAVSLRRTKIGKINLEEAFVCPIFKPNNSRNYS